MTKRPMLVLNGKVKRYGQLSLGFWARGLWALEQIVLDDKWLEDARVSFGARPSGRRIIYVDVPEVIDGMD